MVQKSSKGNTVTISVDIWYDTKTGIIHVASRDPDPAASDFHVAVTNDPKKPNGHPTLFRRLKKLLQSKGAPAPP
jgi:hypothetical protein